MCAHRDMLSMSNFWTAGVQKMELSTKKLLLGCCGPMRHFTLIPIKLNMCTWRVHEGSVMVASAQNVLKSIWTKAEWWLCTSHKLFGIGDIMKDHPSFGDLIEELYSSVSVIKVPKNNARRRRWLMLLRSKNSDVLIPPQVGETRWKAWRDAADWYIENWKVWFEFLDAEASLYPFKGPEGAKKPLLQHVAELTKKRPMGLLVRLCFISDHCAILQSTLNLAQDYGTACFL